MRILILLVGLFGLFLAEMVDAQFGQGSIVHRCNLFDANGLPTEDALIKHGPFILGLSQPGHIHHMNTTVMHNHIPGYTTFEDYSHDQTYQVNGFELTTGGCANTHLRFKERLPRHFVMGKWIDEIYADQMATQQYAGSGPEPLLNSYGIKALEPILFDELGATVLKMRARLTSSFSYCASYNILLPNRRELPILDEIVVITPATLGRLAQGNLSGAEAYYSYNVHQGIHNGYVDWGHIYRLEKECEGSTGAVADACECHRRFLLGELTLENDPLAAAAGQYHEVYTCRLDLEEDEEEGAEFKSTRNAPEVRWPSDPLAQITYAFALDGVLTFDQPLQHVPGMHIPADEHNRIFRQKESSE